MTTYQRILTIVCLAVGIILAVLVSWWISGNRSYHKGWNDAMASVVPDTVWHTDTVTKEKPVEVEKWKDRVVYVPVTQTDTVHKHDTTYIALQFEKKVYQDSSYRAVVSGFQPSLDEITVYQQTAYITKVKTEYKYPQFILSPALTASVLPGSAFVGAGLDAKLWRGRWEFSLEPGYGLNFMPDGMKRGVYVFGKAEFNLIRK